MLSVKMRQAKFGDDAEAKKTLAEATQLLESVWVQSSKSTLTSETLKTKLREVLEKPPGAQQGEREEYTELRVYAAKFKQTGRSSAIATGRRITERQHSSSSELLWRPRMQMLPRGAGRTCGTLTRSERQETHGG